MAERHSQITHDYSADPKALTDYVDKALWVHESQQSVSADIWRYMSEEKAKQREVTSKALVDKYFDGASMQVSTDASGKMIGTVELNPNEWDTTKVDANDPDIDKKIADFKQAHQQLASETTQTKYSDGTKLNQERDTNREGKLWSSTDLLFLNNNVTIMDNDLAFGGLPTRSLSFTDASKQHESVEFRYRPNDALDRDAAKQYSHSTWQHRLSVVSRGYLGEMPEISSFDR